MKGFYRHASQRLSGSIGEIVQVINQYMNYSVTARSVQLSSDGTRNMSARDKLKKEGNYLD